MPKDGWTKLAHWLERCIKICKSRQLIYGKKLLDFNKNIEQDTEIIALRNIIINYTESL